jgi:porin
VPRTAAIAGTSIAARWSGASASARSSATFRDTMSWRILVLVAACCSTVGPAMPCRAGDAPDRAVAADAAPGAPVDVGCLARLRELGSRRRLLGEMGGGRDALEDAGIVPSLYYHHFLGVQAQGGREPGAAARQSGTGDFFLYVDLEPLMGLSGTEMLLQVKAGYGRNVNPRIGALSDPFDDADGDSTGYVAQLWVQQALLRERVQVRVGYLDQQVILDRNAYANSEDRQFSSTFLDNDNAIVPLAIGLGGALFLTPTDWLQVTLATADADVKPFSPGFDTTFDNWTSLFGYLEIGLRPEASSSRGMLPGNYRFGLVWDPRRKERFAGGADTGAVAERGDAGVYVSFDQLVYRETPSHAQGLGLFARYGYRDPNVNAISHFWSVGAQYEGPLPRRDADVVGLGTYTSHASPDFRRAGHPNVRYETGFELYYSMAVLPWLQVTPDVQFIVNPGARRSVENAVVLGLRGRVTF